MTLVSRLTRSIAAISLLALPLSAQTIRHRSVTPPTKIVVTVTGTITDATTGLPIAGADVTAEGRKSKLTDSFGKYSIDISKGINVVLTAEQFAYNSQTQTVFGQAGNTVNFALTPKSTVTVKLTSGTSVVMDVDSAQFAYLIPFSGYIHGDIGNFCKDDGTAFTPDKKDIARVVGPAQSVDFSPCCKIGPIMKASIEMKNGDKFPVYFADSCFGNEVDFIGREKSTGVYQYFRWTDIAEVDFP